MMQQVEAADSPVAQAIKDLVYDHPCDHTGDRIYRFNGTVHSSYAGRNTCVKCGNDKPGEYIWYKKTTDKWMMKHWYFSHSRAHGRRTLPGGDGPELPQLAFCIMCEGCLKDKFIGFDGEPTKYERCTGLTFNRRDAYTASASTLAISGGHLLVRQCKNWYLRPVVRVKRARQEEALPEAKKPKLEDNQ